MKHTSSHPVTQQDRLLAYLRDHEIARAFELREIGVSATAISRAVEAGDVVRIGRGLYQATDAEADLNTNLAEVAKRAPRSVICLLSALAFHGLTDQLPRNVLCGWLLRCKGFLTFWHALVWYGLVSGLLIAG